MFSRSSCKLLQVPAFKSAKCTKVNSDKPPGSMWNLSFGTRETFMIQFSNLMEVYLKKMEITEYNSVR